MLFMLWVMQNDFFRRYGLTDGVAVWLNAALMFLVILFVYPIKFLFTFLVDMFLGMPLTVPGPNGGRVPMILTREMPRLMTIYGLALMAVFLLFSLLHGHAARRREEIGLDDREDQEAITLPPACFWAGIVY